MNTDEIVTMKLAVEKFGKQSQIDMAIEECSELINALCKLRRQRVGPIDVITEIDDVQIMCGQLAYIFGENAVEDERKRKIQRLKCRIESYNGNKS